MRAMARMLPLIWFGMLVAIALEAWLKFKAPGVTREIGLGIGKLIFTAINRIELLIAALLAAAIFMSVRVLAARIVFGFTAAVLLVQTFWLMPMLIERIDAITSGMPPPQSSAHMFYIACEVLKMVLLITLSVILDRHLSGRNESATA